MCATLFGQQRKALSSFARLLGVYILALWGLRLELGQVVFVSHLLSDTKLMKPCNNLMKLSPWQGAEAALKIPCPCIMCMYICILYIYCIYIVIYVYTSMSCVQYHIVFVCVVYACICMCGVPQLNIKLNIKEPNGVGSMQRSSNIPNPCKL